MSEIVFDIDRFYTDLDRFRRARKATWSEVTKEAGVKGSSSMISRLAYGAQGCSLNNMVRLLRWMGKTDIADYIKEEPV